MQKNENFRLELVNTSRIKRISGLKIDASLKKIEKTQKFSKARGHCMPVILSESDGCMTLLSGAAVFESNLKEKAIKIPAIIVKTDGDADNLLFSLQSAFLNESPDMIAVSSAIVQLIDFYGFSRKNIAEIMERAPSWVTRMESLSRRLNDPVKDMVAQGHISSRTAYEIARLPPGVQTVFAVSVGNEFLNKESVAYLVNRYLNEDLREEEQDRIINAPRLALPEEKKKHNFKGRDCSESARLSHAICRCMDISLSLTYMIDKIDIHSVSIRQTDITELVKCLNELVLRIQALISPGE